jgi:hypothetical protein
LHQILHSYHSNNFHLERQFHNYLHDVHKKGCMHVLLQATNSIKPEISCFHRTYPELIKYSFIFKPCVILCLEK